MTTIIIVAARQGGGFNNTSQLFGVLALWKLASG